MRIYKCNKLIFLIDNIIFRGKHQIKLIRRYLKINQDYYFKINNQENNNNINYKNKNDKI